MSHWNYSFVFKVIWSLIQIAFCSFTLMKSSLLFDTVLIPQVILVLLIITGVYILVFKPFKVILLINYIFIALVFSYLNRGVFNVDTKFFVCGSLFLVILPLLGLREQIKRNQLKAVYLLFIVLASYLFLGGFCTKLTDEYWQSGLGMWYVLKLPWISSLSDSPILNWKPFMYILNYFTMFTEMSILPLFLFKKTRKVSILLFGSFVFVLLIILNISLIGPMGLAFLVLFMTIFFNDDLDLREVFDLKELMLRVKTFNPIKKNDLDKLTYPFIVCLFLFFFFLELFLMVFDVNFKNSENMNRLKNLQKCFLL